MGTMSIPFEALSVASENSLETFSGTSVSQHSERHVFLFPYGFYPS